MNNSEVAKIFFEIAELLELKNVRFKPMAYKNAALTIESLEENIVYLYKSGSPPKLPGIGDAISKKIKEIIETGKLDYLENLKKEFPEVIIKLLRIPGIGPKTARLIHENLNLDTINDLIMAAKTHKISNIKGIGPKTEQLILKNIQLLEKNENS